MYMKNNMNIKMMICMLIIAGGGVNSLHGKYTAAGLATGPATTNTGVAVTSADTSSQEWVKKYYKWVLESTAQDQRVVTNLLSCIPFIMNEKVTKAMIQDAILIWHRSCETLQLLRDTNNRDLYVREVIKTIRDSALCETQDELLVLEMSEAFCKKIECVLDKSTDYHEASEFLRSAYSEILSGMKRVISANAVLASAAQPVQGVANAAGTVMGGVSKDDHKSNG